MAKDIAVLGAKGMLGSELADLFENQGIECDTYDLPEFDITDYERLENTVSEHPLIINCAAYTHVDKAEHEFDKAYKINAEAVGRIGKFARKSGSWVLHIGTDFVFDGRSLDPYREKDIPNPINSYGVTKHAGEQLLTHSNCRYCIVRVQWTYGKNGNNFVKKIISKAQKEGVLKVVDDQVGSPTSTNSIASLIRSLIEFQPLGLYHYASSEYVSRHETAKYIIEKAGIDAEVQKCKTEDFPSTAKRPLNSRLDCTKIKKTMSVELPSWKDSMDEYLGSLCEIY